MLSEKFKVMTEPTKEFILYKLKSRLHYLETENPLIYEVFDAKGKWICSFTEQRYLARYENEGYTICLGDLQEEIERLRKSILIITSS